MTPIALILAAALASPTPSPNHMMQGHSMQAHSMKNNHSMKSGSMKSSHMMSHTSPSPKPKP